MGKAGSGKDHARIIAEDMGLVYAISHTTRPPRTGEVNGKDYFFISEEEFHTKDWYEWKCFNGWYYGLSREYFDKGHIILMTPSGVASLPQEDRKESCVVYLDMPEEVRKYRLALRSDADSVERRLEADRKDFADFVDYDQIVTDPYYDAVRLMERWSSSIITNN